MLPVIEVMVFHSGKHKKFEAIVEYRGKLNMEMSSESEGVFEQMLTFHYAHILPEPGPCKVVGRAFMTAFHMFSLVYTARKLSLK